MGGWESVEREKDNRTENTVSPSPAQTPQDSPRPVMHRSGNSA